MMRVLFVDDEPNILNGIRRLLRPMRDKWDMTFVGSGDEALKCAAQTPFNVIVSDMKMPGMDGAQLLSEIKRQYPETIRIALSAQTASHMIYRCLQNAHQYVAKPCDPELLVATVQRACNLRDLMNNEQLRKMVASLSTLPSLPDHYDRIMRELQSDDPSLHKVAEIVKSDVAMTAKILQIVNSPFFGVVQHVRSPTDATMLLGVDTIRSLVLTTGVFSQFAESGITAKRLQAIWSHSAQVSALAKTIAIQHTNQKMYGDYALMGGLLLDVGKLILASNLGEEFVRAETIAAQECRPDWEVERELVGHTHMELGAYLVGLWGLPNPVVECVAYHHIPGECVEANFSPLTAVHISNAIVRANGSDDLTELDMDYMDKLGITEKLPEWRALYEEVFAPSAEVSNG